MSSLPPSFRRQQLLLHYASLKTICPEGIYLVPVADNPSLWAGVFCVREGPYASAVLRLTLHFPRQYPTIAPSVSFSTEIFHPLLVPLTTYTFATGAVDPNASGDHEDRPAPGSFNLRHCLEHERASSIPGTPKLETHPEIYEQLPLVELLRYIKQAFEDAVFLDNLPLSAAANTNAWHAWRAHRGLPKLGSRSISPASTESGRAPKSPSKNPGDWNWEGVWESRVRNGIEESISDLALFGSKNARGTVSSNTAIRFTKQDDDRIEEIQAVLLKVMGFGC